MTPGVCDDRHTPGALAHPAGTTRPGARCTWSSLVLGGLVFAAVVRTRWVRLPLRPRGPWGRSCLAEATRRMRRHDVCGRARLHALRGGGMRRRHRCGPTCGGTPPMLPSAAGYGHRTRSRARPRPAGHVPWGHCAACTTRCPLDTGATPDTPGCRHARTTGPGPLPWRCHTGAPGAWWRPRRHAGGVPPPSGGRRAGASARRLPHPDEGAGRHNPNALSNDVLRDICALRAVYGDAATQSEAV